MSTLLGLEFVSVITIRIARTKIPEENEAMEIPRSLINKLSNNATI